MRIAVVNWTDRIVGGAERYIDQSIPHIQAAEHQVALWVPQSSTPLRTTANHAPDLKKVGGGTIAALECISDLKALSAWNPHVICVHSVLPAGVEESLFNIAPTILFGHGYIGACISGYKTLHDPDPHPCSRTLGPGCLWHYFPHRCGGLNPITMISDYQRNTDQLRRLRHYAAIVTFSSHMKSEFVKHRIPGPRVLLIPPFTPLGNERRRLPLLEPHTTLPPLAAKNKGTALGYLGRLERGKGLSILLDALPRVCAVLERPLTLRIAGEGSGRAKVGSRAQAVTSANPDIRIFFDEWLPDDRHDEFFAAIDLLVVPSVWPEPFGLVGLEAGAHGVPAAAFEVGGIPDWLIDGTNGHLAKGPRPTKDRLAEAIVACLSDIEHYARLRQGAHEIATVFSPGAHIDSLLRLFQNVAIAPTAH